jgi:hypothetical protein
VCVAYSARCTGRPLVHHVHRDTRCSRLLRTRHSCMFTHQTHGVHVRRHGNTCSPCSIRSKVLIITRPTAAGVHASKWLCHVQMPNVCGRLRLSFCFAVTRHSACLPLKGTDMFSTLYFVCCVMYFQCTILRQVVVVMGAGIGKHTVLRVLCYVQPR